MTDSIDFLFLFDHPLDAADRVGVFERLSALDGFECSTDPEELDDALSGGRSAFTNASYRSVHTIVNLDPETEALNPIPRVALTFEEIAFKERVSGEAEVKQHVQDAIALVTTAYELLVDAGLPPTYVVGANLTQTEQLRTGGDLVRTTVEGVRSGELEELFWLQILSPERVADIGRDELESAPAWRTETLEDGAVLLVAYENPLSMDERYPDLLEYLSLERNEGK